MKRMLLGVAVVAIALAAQAQMGGKSAEVGKAVAGLEAQWTAGAKASNADMVAPLLADGFVNMNSDGTLADKTKTLANTAKAKWDSNEIGDVKVTVYGNTAIATGTWQGKGTTADGKAIDAHERWVDTWMKMPSGKWQCVASAGAPVKM